MTSRHSDTPVKRRPKNRKDQIIARAQALFVDRGFPHVSMASIADEVGITAGALYRHFANKTSLLAAVFDENFEFLNDPIPSGDVEDFIDYGVGLVIENPRVGILWKREIRYLPPELRAKYRRSFRDWSRSLLPLLRQMRPDLGEKQRETLVWAFASVLSSLYTHTRVIQGETRTAVAKEAIRAIAHVHLEKDEPRLMPTLDWQLRSRRERILQAALEQFSAYGYSESSMSSIGTAADVSGQSLYSYFGSKADLLQAVLDRGDHAAWFVLDHVLESSTSPTDALERLLSAQWSFSPIWTRWAVEPEYGSEQLEQLRSSQREYVNEWVALICRARPDLTEAEARVKVTIATAVLSDLRQVSEASGASGQPAIASRAIAIARAVLFGPVSPGIAAHDLGTEHISQQTRK